MRKKILLILLIGVMTISSCNNPSENKYSTKDTHSTEDSTQKYVNNPSNTSDLPVKKEDFEILRINECSITKDTGVGVYDATCVVFKFEFEMQNQTNTAISRTDAIGQIKLEFKNGDTMTLPKGSFCEVVKFSVNTDSLWKPNTKRTFTYKTEENDLCMYSGLLLSHFERTPILAKFVFSYNFIGVDGEFNDTKEYDLLDKWKEFQKTLGLR